MKAWQELVRQALTGNNTSMSLSPALLNKMNAYGFSVPGNLTAEKALLKTAAIHRQLHSTAQIPEKYTVKKINNSEAEQLSYCSEERNLQLENIIQKKYDNILKEFLNRLAEKELILAPASLPGLFNYVKHKPELYELSLQCSGNRGRWLTECIKEWEYLKEEKEDNSEKFYYGNLQERLIYLHKLRKEKPSEALNIIAEVWDSEGYLAKAEFIKVLETGLSAADDNFLEQALDDKRKEVRRAAANLLSQLPESALVIRMQELARGMVRYNKKRDSVQIHLPQACTKAMRRDGIQSRKIFIKDCGPMANLLAQVISKIPPGWWLDYLDKSPEELLQWSVKTEWRKVFFHGWAKASKNFGDEGWIIACHKFYLKNIRTYSTKDFSVNFMYDNLNNKLFNRFAREYFITDKSNTFADEQAIVSFLLIDNKQWDEDISLKVIQRIKQTILQDSHVFHWSLKTVLKRAAFAIPAVQYLKVKEGWPTQSYAWNSWQKEVGNFLSILKFRWEVAYHKD
jgi:hypothetical protein